MRLVIGHLYPDLLNIYGDRGNLLTLLQRARWRGFDAQIVAIGPDEPLDPEACDLYFIGGGQDCQQIRVSEDLRAHKADALREAVALGAVILAICGGYQLLGHYYRPHQGPELPGISLIDAHTIAGDKRMIGNVSIRRPDGSTVAGFENHSGQTFLGPGVSPLGTVIRGGGNNGRDKTEGVAVGGIYGTYLHGSLLPKNPALADELIFKALKRRYGPLTLSSLPDTLENDAHQRALALRP
ncbi:MAG: glutamine amidotransferase [Vampirovibrionales bacterium]|nr:glutamine amidotransferase [Vampirovibrionales bacterium]